MTDEKTKTLMKSVDSLVKKADVASEIAKDQREIADQQRATADEQHKAAHHLEVLSEELADGAAILKKKIDAAV